MVIFRQNMQFWAFKLWKKNQAFVDCTFNIDKNIKPTGIQPILKTNSASGMLNSFIFRMNIKKVTGGGGGGVE